MPLTAIRPPAADAPRTPATADVLRTVSDARTPVFVTVHANGRRRYSYWRPLDSTTGRGGCYVALPTAECDELLSTGRIALGDPLADPTKTTYRVRPVRAPQTPARISSAPARPAPARERVRVRAA
ncbi:hypothetical protein NFX46_15950 [Streptomyces phaeoluteigriseus]|uniref:Cell envelope biogenesis protein OmpA n=1 Tax=Streptomyces phaeoluteigriseus TaxID=114686 RepID=A0ABY4Z866_9ACTN|nr:hypothetical protein [Streptomyces phaeoluteigriseus]USQ85150.1 hypothetical protein NFX46_15950 [Streptomyces phaeoluteigriseus]